MKKINLLTLILFWSLFFYAFFSTENLLAQSVVLPELPFEKIDFDLAIQSKLNPKQVATSATIKNYHTLPNTQDLAKKLSNRFKTASQPLQNFDISNSNCKNNFEFNDTLFALYISGRFSDLDQWVQGCDVNQLDAHSYLNLSLAQLAQSHYAQAETYFEKGLTPQFAQDKNAAEIIFQYATYAQFNSKEDQVENILKTNNVFNTNDIKYWKNLILLAGHLELENIEPNLITQFLDQQLSNANLTLSFKDLLLSLKVRILYLDHNFNQIFNIYSSTSFNIVNPMNWYSLMYDTIYYGADQNFSIARNIYDAYDQYAKPFWRFPVENNTYNYTQIYTSICPKNLAQNQAQTDLKTLQNQIRSGKIKITDALVKINSLDQSYQQKSDILTTKAGLLALNQQHELAFTTYWQAHQLCRYYHRANWGLTLENRYLKYSNRPDYKKNENKIQPLLDQYTVPTEVSSYFSDWNSLDLESQKRVLYGSRIWLDYIPTLNKNSFKTYLKFSFDLLSDSPSSKNLRDQRIGGFNYPNDNRLWDDVRGVGGSTVVADISEVFQTVQGDYNLLGHEMAHQFQSLLEKTGSSAFNCIPTQFNLAQKNNNFPDNYSSNNKEEHFAQGVTYYLIPSDSPKSFGLNQSWILNHNPGQFNFIKSIESAHGNLDQIKCL